MGTGIINIMVWTLLQRLHHLAMPPKQSIQANEIKPEQTKKKGKQKQIQKTKQKTGKLIFIIFKVLNSTNFKIANT